MRTKIIFEDRDLLVIHKPAGLATQTRAVGQADVVSELKGYLKGGDSRPYLGVIHRLDQPVEGLLVFAKTPDAASALSRQLQSGELCKRYYAVVYGKPNAQGECSDLLYKDRENRARIVSEDQGFPEAKPARLHYRRLSTASREREYSLLEIRIETGRFHQIRAQMAHAGYPLLGDAKYGTEESMAFGRKLGVRYTALCACQLDLRHPVTGEWLHFAVEPTEEIFAGIGNS